jgi:hypothetical protein
VANVRGTTILNTVRFVKERYGLEAHDRVVRELPQKHWGTFLGPVREASWKPAADLAAYMDKAREVLAPGDTEFYRDVGRMAGQLNRDTAFVAMFRDPETATRQAPVIWRAFWDAGRLEVVSNTSNEIRIRIHDFPQPHRALCDRIVGFWEGSFTAWGAQGARVVETACVLEGGRYCEMRAQWDGPIADPA